MHNLIHYENGQSMLSFINLSVQDRKKTVIENLQAAFLEGFVYGLYAPDAALLRPLLECISGRSSTYKGDLVYNDGPLAGQVTYIDCQQPAAPRKRIRTNEPAGIMAGPVFPLYSSMPPQADPLMDFSQKILLLHDLRAAGHTRSPWLDFLETHTIPPRNMVIITSHDYAALKNTCDFIYLFDKKRFPIVVEKADFAMFDYYFENVFRR